MDHLANVFGRLGENPKLCFEKYVDVSLGYVCGMLSRRSINFGMQAVIDLLIPGQTPGIKEKLVDLYGKPELLFFGPDGALLSTVCMFRSS